jgi:hypothetical protein
MNKKLVSLKIDFKYDEKNILRIVDIGDGLGAGTEGFEATLISKV